MSTSLKPQLQTKGQSNLHAKCRYCGNAWFPFPDKVLRPPVEAAVKCPKCKSKQHLHWISSIALPASQSSSSLFPSLKSVDFEKKKVPIPHAESTTPAPNVPITVETKHGAPEVEPLPEIKENEAPAKQEARPVFKASLFNSSLKRDSKPIFKASRLQNKPVVKTEAPPPAEEPALEQAQPVRESPPEQKPNIKPLVPAPVTEIKIESEPKENLPARETHEATEEIKVEIRSPPKIEPKPKIEEKASLFKPYVPEVAEPEQPEAEPEVRTVKNPPEKLEPAATQAPQKEEKTEEEPKTASLPEKPQPVAERKSMFRSSSLKATSGPTRPLFKSHFKRDSKPPIEIPEVRGEPGEPIPVPIPEPQVAPEEAKAVEEEESPREVRAEKRPRSRSKRESMLQPRKAELEVRQSPLDDEPEIQSTPKPTAEPAPETAAQESEPKPAPSGLFGKRKSKKKISEDPAEPEESA
jgi:hypothetical protein